jgi:putative Ca2+/H+ antiporter (TMEM165/GDT1 family)
LVVAEQIGLTPEEVVAKIMANPEVAVAFQNPRVQAAIMDVSGPKSFLIIALLISSFSPFPVCHGIKISKFSAPFLKFPLGLQSPFSIMVHDQYLILGMSCLTLILKDLGSKSNEDKTEH